MSAPDNEVESDELAKGVVASPCAHVGSLGGLDIDILACRLVGPRGEGLRRGIGGDVGREVIGGRLRGMRPRVDVVGDEGVGELENDVHGEGVCASPGDRIGSWN